MASFPPSRRQGRATLSHSKLSCLQVLLAPLLFVLGKRALRRSTLTMLLVRAPAASDTERMRACDIGSGLERKIGKRRRLQVVVLVGFFAQRNNIHLA